MFFTIRKGVFFDEKSISHRPWSGGALPAKFLVPEMVYGLWYNLIQTNFFKWDLMFS
jgi:hypothetical protein